MDLRTIINIVEAPIGDISFHGGHEPASLRADDIGIATSPKAQAKMRRVLEKAPLPINLVFVNHTMGYEDEENIGDPNRRLGTGAKASGAMTGEQFEERYGIEIKSDPSALTAVFAFNEGTERRPFTPWMIAHRLAHLVEEADYDPDSRGPIAQVMIDLRGIWKNLGYDAVGLTDIQNISPLLSTTKAGRDGEIVNQGEFFMECFAQFLVTGKIRLNPVTAEMDIPVTHDMQRLSPKFADMIRANPKTTIFKPDLVNKALRLWADNSEKAFAKALEDLRGKIVVM